MWETKGKYLDTEVQVFRDGVEVWHPGTLRQKAVPRIQQVVRVPAATFKLVKATSSQPLDDFKDDIKVEVNGDVMEVEADVKEDQVAWLKKAREMVFKRPFTAPIFPDIDTDFPPKEALFLDFKNLDL